MYNAFADDPDYTYRHQGVRHSLSYLPDEESLTTASAVESKYMRPECRLAPEPVHRNPR